MIDFTNCAVRNKAYTGANGNKISIVYNGEVYMLKFPALPSINKKMSYANGCISEYLGSKIFASIGIPTQEVLLGKYVTSNGGEKIVVACKDFTIKQGLVLQDFASLKNTVIDSVRHGNGTDLNDIEEAISGQHSFDPAVLREHFWNMFIVDALIGNWDRHNGNWGFLYNVQTDEISLAPVYDCGSSLFPQADESIVHEVLTNQNAVNQRVYNIPTSAVMKDGKRINYFSFISSLENENCNAALKRIMPRIDMDKIFKIVDAVDVIDTEQKSFYKTMLSARKERILDFSFERLQERERENQAPQAETRPSVMSRIKTIKRTQENTPAAPSKKQRDHTPER